MMTSSILSLNFFYCPSIYSASSIFTDWFNLRKLPDSTVIDCFWNRDTVQSGLKWHSPRAYNTLVRGGIPHSFDDTFGFYESSFSIVIDSGASLAISPYTSDFAGNMNKVNLRLGEMANGMIIEGK